jgi:hypothetical protein
LSGFKEKEGRRPLLILIRKTEKYYLETLKLALLVSVAELFVVLVIRIL